MAKPLHIQRLEASLDMGPFMEFAQDMLSRPLTSEDSDSESDNHSMDRVVHGIVTSKSDRINDKIRIFNFSNIGPDRKWLQDVLLSDTESEEEVSDDERVREMLKNHAKELRIRNKFYKNPKNVQFGYYGSGLLSNYDMFPEHQRNVVGLKKPRKYNKEKKPEKQPKKYLKTKEKEQLDDLDWDESQFKDEFDEDFDSRPSSPKFGLRGRKKTNIKTPEVMAARRRKIWQMMAKKEVGKVQRARMNNHKELVTNCKKVATFCMKFCRQKAMQSQKNMKEAIWRAKRLSREMQTYWRRYDRVERETKRRLEKEAEEQRKQDVEMIEVKRQQRKLNFLITQTELYAHFMSKKNCDPADEEQQMILNQLEEEANPRLALIDDYDSEAMKLKAQRNAAEAFNQERARTELFDVNSAPNLKHEYLEELPQPSIFQGSLKGYQLKGMTWLANLYNQGISGILADEMGLGKTVQSIAFLCHIAEQYGVWGPFLVISPASTLHNWQQEMQRFVPGFNVVPYWGSPNERKILRQFWEQKDLHTKDASFHVVITSYQLIVSDYKYFNRIKWQYMVLDEAQAIKSSSSVRWKLLLGFNCRNRLLLSGTPIQNSMAELWALLHFIMPTLFDSHEEFNEWFSKDIESHAENKTGIDEKQISRLHMILKPFMLRRIKKDVENELSDKIEIMVYCPLTTRQKLLYMALKKKIRIEDLLHFTGNGEGSSVDKSFTSSLMNLVMQFRKVCNHPELFERRDVRSPFSVKTQEYVMPRLIFNEGLLNRSFPSKNHLIYNKFNIFKAENIQRSLFPKDKSNKLINYTNFIDLGPDSCFSFTRLSNLSPNEVDKMKILGLIYYLNHIQEFQKEQIKYNVKRMWHPEERDSKWMLLEPTVENRLNPLFFEPQSVFWKLVFTKMVSKVYCHTQQRLEGMQETMEHRIIRSKHKSHFPVKIEEIKSEVIEMREEHSKGHSPSKAHNSPQSNLVLIPEFPHKQLESQVFDCHPTEMPEFVFNLPPKVQNTGRKLYCEHRGAQWVAIRHDLCENDEGKSLITNGLDVCKPKPGWSNIIIPDKQTLVSDAGKLAVLDSLLTRLKSNGHRVLIYSQMTKMIDLLEEYMWHRKHRYMRLDGSSKISARRDMVADFQNRADIFVFLLSTRAGGLGINLTAADTVIFYDSDWNPTVDQQAMDRAHRLGQTKQVTVYRLICKGTIEERILQRAREKSEIQRMVISGGNFKPDTLKPKEVVSLLLDDEEIELKYRQKTEERKSIDEAPRAEKERDRKRKPNNSTNKNSSSVIESSLKKFRVEGLLEEEALLESAAPSPAPSEISHSSGRFLTENSALLDDSSNEALVVDCDSPGGPSTPVSFNMDKPSRKQTSRGIKRGRPGKGNRSGLPGQERTMVNPETLPGMRRGPGRPRTNLSGNRSYRSNPRPRKPAGPLVVPLGQSPAPTPPGPSPAMSPAPSPAPPGLGFYQPMNEEM